MRVLNVSAQKPDTTGSGIYLAETVRSEIAMGHEAAVVGGLGAEDGTPTLPTAARVYPVRFDTPELSFHVCGMSDVMPYPATRYRDLTPEMAGLFERAFTARIRQALEEFAPDVVVCHHLYLVTALVRECAPDLPVGAVCHSTGLRQLAQIPFERERICRDVRALDAVFALHEAQAARISDELGVDPRRIHIVGAGINTRLFSRGGAGTPARRRGRICYAGKIWSKKGVMSLVEALDLISPEMLPEGVRGLEVRMAGAAGADREDFEAIVSRARACRWPIEFLGKLPQDRLADEYRAAEVYVLPSFYEGLPLVVGEALACGCKDVVSDLPGLRPWYASHVPGAPIVWVEPPRMAGVDEPVAAELPAFSERVARALVEALAMPAPDCDVSAMSWDRIAADVIGGLQ